MVLLFGAFSNSCYAEEVSNVTVQGVYYSNGSQYYDTGVLTSIDGSSDLVRLYPFNVSYTADDYIFISKSDGTTLVPEDRDFEVDVKYIKSSLIFTESDGSLAHVYPHLENVSISLLGYEKDGTIHSFSNNLTLKRLSGSYYEMHASIPAQNFEISSFRFRINYGRYESGFDLSSVSLPFKSVEREVGFSENKPLVSIQSEESSWLKKVFNSILDLPSKLSDMLTNFFLPDEEFIADYKNNFDELLSEHLGAVYEVFDFFSTIYNAIDSDIDSQDSIEMPVVNVSLAGTTFSFGGYTVHLIPDRFAPIVDTLKILLGIVVTLLFVNMLKKRYEGIVSK